jgi:hypothetical protein
VPASRKHLIEHDEHSSGSGERNPVKRGWFDLEMVDGVARMNRRALDRCPERREPCAPS